MKQFSKITWMAFWRILVLNFFVGKLSTSAPFDMSVFGVLVLSLVIAGVMVFGLKKTIETFPLVTIIKGGAAIVDINSTSNNTFNEYNHINNVKNQSTPDYILNDAEMSKLAEIRAYESKTMTYEQFYNKYGNTYPDEMPARNANNFYENVKRVSHASANGRMTGYEPSILENVSAPTIGNGLFNRMIGIPGFGLTSAVKTDENETQQYGNFEAKNVEYGQLGEMNFAKALSITSLSMNNYATHPNYDNFRKNSLLNNVTSFWSVAMPSNDNLSIPDAEYNTDIDCMIVGEKEILLIDLKYYRSGDVTYRNFDNQLYCVDNQTGYIVGEPYKMSKNMQMAKNRFQKHLPHMIITALVVMIPTDKGTAQIENVYWPGQIPAMNIEQGLTQVKRISAEHHVNYQLINALTPLSKNNQINI